MKSTRLTVLKSALILMGVAFAAGCSAPQREVAGDERHRPQTLRLSYGADADNYGILHLPEGDGPRPVVVMVHGGGWLEDHDLSYFEPLSQSLADEGVAVWNIEYRRVGGTGGWPTTLADADNATDARAPSVQEAAGGRLDLERVHLAGHSAGVHLAAWISGRHTLPPDAPGTQPQIRPVSASLMAGVFDLRLAATAGHDSFVRGLLGVCPRTIPTAT